MKLILCQLICGALGALIGVKKNRLTVGFLLGVSLGPIGWFLLMFIPEKQEEIDQYIIKTNTENKD